MCGITGFIDFNKSKNRDVIGRMALSIGHRGPDGQGLYFDDIGRANVALGHRRLSIIDLSDGANQPMYSSCGRYVMVYNGEVYNYQELRAALLKNFPLKTRSDTEVILECFVKEGIKAVNNWNGMFALAIWDTLDHRLTLIRDRLGKKPLYYYWDGALFAFASELKGLKPLALNLSVSKKAVATYLNIGYIPQPYSVYEQISKLPPGCYLQLYNKEVVIETYWRAVQQVRSDIITNFTDAKSRLKDLLISAVQYRMIADVPYGAFLSGGVDSSLVTAIAQSVSSNPLKTFSIGFKEKSFNETGYAKKVSQFLKTEHYSIDVSEQDGLELIDDITKVYDEPYADVSAVPTMLVSKFAAQHVKMVITGDGGDELFSGYGTYDWAERMANPALWILRGLVSSVFKHGNVQFKKAAAILDIDSEINLQQHIFSQEQGFFSYKKIISDFSVGAPYEMFAKPELKRHLNKRELQSLFDLQYYLPDDLLVKIDRATMRYGLEGRSPLLDYRIAEFALNLSPLLKKQGKTVKYILKELLYDYLPKEYFDRPKWGFAFPLEKLMKNELSFLIDTYLSRQVTQSIAVCNYSYINKLKQLYKAGQTHVYYKLWTVIQLHKWYLENI